MSAVPEAVSLRMRQVLEGVVGSLSDGQDLAHLVQAHAWYDENYVGGAGDKVSAWRGWSANLRSLGDFRTIYFNYVVNPFSHEENTALFGSAFAHVVAELEDYVCIYVTACSLKHIPEFVAQGFTYKAFARNMHPGRVKPITDFLLTPVSSLIDDGVKLVLLQRDLC